MCLLSLPKGKKVSRAATLGVYVASIVLLALGAGLGVGRKESILDFSAQPNCIPNIEDTITVSQHTRSITMPTRSYLTATGFGLQAGETATQMSAYAADETDTQRAVQVLSEKYTEPPFPVGDIVGVFKVVDQRVESLDVECVFIGIQLAQTSIGGPAAIVTFDGSGTIAKNWVWGIPTSDLILPTVPQSITIADDSITIPTIMKRPHVRLDLERVSGPICVPDSPIIPFVRDVRGPTWDGKFFASWMTQDDANNQYYVLETAGNETLDKRSFAMQIDSSGVKGPLIRGRPSSPFSYIKCT
jgi:hypothetical protein